MKLMTKALAAKLPALRSTDGSGEDARIYVGKWVTPTSSWTWYASEYDPETEECFGFAVNDADPHSAELGYFSLAEMAAVRGPMGLGVERDLYHQPMTLTEIRERHGLR